MRLGLTSVVVVLTAAVPLSNAQDQNKQTRSKEREERLHALIQDFLKARKEGYAALRQAQTDQERKAAQEKLPKEGDYLPRIHLLVSSGANDDVAAEALAFAVFGLDTKDEKVFEALNTQFVKTDKIRRFVQMAMSGAPDGAKPVLATVLEKNPSKELKGLACYALGTMAFEKNGEKAAKEAEVYFARVEKDFADIKAGRKGTLGEMAKGSLFELRNLQVGMRAPTAESKNLKGEKVSLADYQGRVVVLDIWTTWCGPCRAMIPHEREMVAKLKDKPFALISISVDENKKELDEFLEKESMPWAHWWDGAEAPLVKQWNVRFFPTIYVIDAKGVIRHKNIRGEELEKAVEKLVAEAKP